MLARKQASNEGQRTTHITTPPPPAQISNASATQRKCAGAPSRRTRKLYKITSNFNRHNTTVALSFNCAHLHTTRLHPRHHPLHPFICKPQTLPLPHRHNGSTNRQHIRSPNASHRLCPRDQGQPPAQILCPIRAPTADRHLRFALGRSLSSARPAILACAQAAHRRLGQSRQYMLPKLGTPMSSPLPPARLVAPTFHPHQARASRSVLRLLLLGTTRHHRSFRRTNRCPPSARLQLPRLAQHLPRRPARGRPRVCTRLVGSYVPCRTPRLRSSPRQATIAAA